MITAKKMVSPDQDYRTFSNNRPFGYYWLGRIYEKQGKIQNSITTYESLLDLWKNGDERIPELIDTKKRLEKLKKTS